MKLKEHEISSRLRKLRGWQQNNDEITKTFEFKDFSESMKFANHIAELAEQASHHPDINIKYSSVTLSLSTHSAGGLTVKDFELAEKIEKMVRE